MITFEQSEKNVHAIFYPPPLTNKLTVSVDRNLLPCQDTGDEDWQCLLRMLPKTVIVFTSRDSRVQPERVGIRDRQGIASRFRSGVRIGRIDPSIFSISSLRNGSVHFVS